MISMARRTLVVVAAFAVVEAAPGSTQMATPDSAEVNNQIPFGLATFLSDDEEAPPLSRIAVLEAQIQPLFDASPKHRGGAGLDAEAAKYVLQRHFLESHGWRVKALGGDHGQATAGSHSGVSAKSAPGRLADFLKTTLVGTQFGLRELATLAATIEKSVRMEAAELLSTALAVHGVSEQDLNEETRDLVIQTFMLFYILPDTDDSKQTLESIKGHLGLAERVELIKGHLRSAERVYPGWDATMKWVKELQRTMKSAGSTLQGFVEEIVLRYRHVFDNHCSSLRSSLLKFEQPGTGRVLVSRLRSISAGAHIPNTIWQFSETNDELRSMGVLDESDPRGPTIIIPNYMTADANCLPSSQIASTCCMSECDLLIAELEGQFSSPTVSPQQLSDWFRALNVSEVSVTQLEEIASSNGGGLPIHGKAFAQWLHGVFPAKCPLQQDTRGWASARWVLRSLALLFAAASGVAGLAKTVLSQKSGKHKKVD